MTCDRWNECTGEERDAGDIGANGEVSVRVNGRGVVRSAKAVRVSEVRYRVGGNAGLQAQAPAVDALIAHKQRFQQIKVSDRNRKPNFAVRDRAPKQKWGRFASKIWLHALSCSALIRLPAAGRGGSFVRAMAVARQEPQGR
jgi:hypothetical protein